MPAKEDLNKENINKRKEGNSPAGSLTRNFPFGFKTLAISAKISVLWMYVDGERRPEIATSNEEFGCAAGKK